MFANSEEENLYSHDHVHEGHFRDGSEDSTSEVVWGNRAMPQEKDAIKNVNRLDHGPWKRSCNYVESEGRFSPSRRKREVEENKWRDENPPDDGSVGYRAGHSSVLEDFKAVDFSLPLEELPDERLSHYEETLQRSQRNRINKAKKSLKVQDLISERLERANQQRVTVDAKFSLAKTYKAGQSINIAHDPMIGPKNSSGILKNRRNRILLEGIDALNIIKHSVGKDMRKTTDMSKMTIEDFGEESTIDFPKLGTLEEKSEDLRQEGYELYCKKHGVTAAARFKNKDKRMLRKWFNELDRDGSGEVRFEFMTR